MIDEVASHYVMRALSDAGGNRSKVARLVGFASYPRFENWSRKYAQEDSD